jgi:hypothetical protein
VEVCRDEAPIGRDRIGWTPVGSDAELSIVGATTIRASVDSSVEQQAGRGYKQEWRHTYTYELLSPTAAEVELIAPKPRDAADIRLDPAAASEAEDEYHWLLKLAPREATKVTVQFSTDSRMAQPLAGR